MHVEDVVTRLVQHVERRFYGKYRGFVVENDDPEQLGRLRLQVPSVLGSEVVTGWAVPCVPYGGMMDQGWLSIPELEAGVWVEFEEGDLEFPVWVGTFWSKPEGNSELPKPNDPDGAEAADVQAPPTRKIFKTVKGLTLQFEDADDDESILLVQPVSDETRNVFRMDNDGITVIRQVDGQTLHTLVLNDDGITLTDAAENQILMTADAFTITAMTAFTISAAGQAVTIEADTIDFNKA